MLELDQKLEERLERIERLLRPPRIRVNEEVPPEERLHTRQVVFSLNLQPLQGVDMEDPCPLTGEIMEVTMAFPQGCNGLVELQFGHGGIPLFPSKKGTYIALNDATPSWRNLREPVSKGEKLWAELRNGDSVNPHEPSILVIITGVE